ncbi:MAG TPA: MmcQ/YjbR family DNA-binding protein [Gemmatimonadaceae bacterium]
MTFDDVKDLAEKFPGVVEDTHYGTRALKVKGQMFVRLREDGETLVVRCDMISRDLMLKVEPKLFFITDHYKNFPAILLRLKAVKTKRMREILEDAWRFRAPKKLVAEYDAKG